MDKYKLEKLRVNYQEDHTAFALAVQNLGLNDTSTTILIAERASTIWKKSRTEYFAALDEMSEKAGTE